MSRLALRDGALALAALSLWAGADAWYDATGLAFAGLVSVLDGFLAGAALGAIAHEWGHFVGARWAGGIAPTLGSYRDIAVLYRSNIQTRALEEALRERQIPYVMYGGQQFYERKEVKDVIAYLRLALSTRDEISLRRVINYPSRGIGASTTRPARASSSGLNLRMSGCVSRASHESAATPIWNPVPRERPPFSLRPTSWKGTGEKNPQIGGV